MIHATLLAYSVRMYSLVFKPIAFDCPCTQTANITLLACYCTWNHWSNCVLKWCVQLLLLLFTHVWQPQPLTQLWQYIGEVLVEVWKAEACQATSVHAIAIYSLFWHVYRSCMYMDANYMMITLSKCRQMRGPYRRDSVLSFIIKC